MKRPKNMPIVLDFAALVVVGLNIPFAVYGYLLFGEATQGERNKYFNIMFMEWSRKFGNLAVGLHDHQSFNVTCMAILYQTAKFNQ